MLTSLRYRDLQALFLSTAFVGVGFQGELIALSWFILEETDSPFLVGVSVAIRFVPFFVLGLLSGAIADRFDRRLLLRLHGIALAANAALLGLLVLIDAPIALVMLGTLSSGALFAFGTVRQSYAVDVSGATEGLSAIAAISLSQRAGGIGGALGVGFIVGVWGPGEAFLTLAVGYLLSSAAMLFAQTKGQAAPERGAGVRQNLREFSRELRSNRSLAVLVALTAAVEVFGFSFLTALPVLIRDVLDAGTESLGVVSAVAAAGGTFAIMAVPLIVRGERRGRVFLVVLHVFGVAIIVLGLSQSLAMAIVAAALVSALAALSDVLTQSLVQLTVPNQMRGRAMGAWTLAIGAAPVGHLQIGALASIFGVQAALAINGGCLILLAALTSIGVRRLRSL